MNCVIDVIRTRIEDLTPEMKGKKVIMRARLQASRLTGTKHLFITLRQRISTVQGVLSVKEGVISKQMLKSCGR